MNKLVSYFLKETFDEDHYTICKSIASFGSFHNSDILNKQIIQKLFPGKTSQQIQDIIQSLIKQAVIKVSLKQKSTSSLNEFNQLSNLGKRNQKGKLIQQQFLQFSEDSFLIKNKFPLFLLHVVNTLGIEVQDLFILINEKGSISIQDLEDQNEIHLMNKLLQNKFIEYVKFIPKEQSSENLYQAQSEPKLSLQKQQKKIKNQLKKQSKVKKESKLTSYFMNQKTGEYYNFKINYKSIIHEMCNHWLVDIVQQRCGTNASKLFHELLLVGIDCFEKAENLNTIFNILGENSGLSKVQIVKNIAILKNDQAKFLQKSQEKYYIHKNDLINYLKQKMLEKYLEINYSKEVARVYRYMRRVGITNFDDVVHKCVLFDGDARKILYILYLKGFIFKKQNKDRNSEAIYYIKPEKGLQQMISHMENDLLRLKLIIKSETEEYLAQDESNIVKLEKLTLEYEDNLLKLKNF